MCGSVIDSGECVLMLGWAFPSCSQYSHFHFLARWPMHAIGKWLVNINCSRGRSELAFRQECLKSLGSGSKKRYSDFILEKTLLDYLIIFLQHATIWFWTHPANESPREGQLTSDSPVCSTVSIQPSSQPPNKYLLWAYYMPGIKESY